MNTLDGEMVTGNEHGYFTKGKVAIGASSPELMQEFIEKDDLVILGNRVESQMCALDIDVSCMVVCQNAEVSEEVINGSQTDQPERSGQALYDEDTTYLFPYE